MIEQSNELEPASEFITVAEYAQRMGITEGTVRRLARDGYLPAVKLGPRLWRIDADAQLPRPPVERPPHDEVAMQPHEAA